MQQWHFYDIKKLSKLKLCYSYRNVNALAFISILTLFYCIMLIKVPTNEKKTRNKDYRLECNKVVTLQFLVEKKSLGIALNLQSCSKLVRIE